MLPASCITHVTRKCVICNYTSCRKAPRSHEKTAKAEFPTACHQHTQGTTVLHEMAHLDLGDGFGQTLDHAYGYVNVTKLDKEKALENADSYTIYVEGRSDHP